MRKTCSEDEGWPDENRGDPQNEGVTGPSATKDRQSRSLRTRSMGFFREVWHSEVGGRTMVLTDHIGTCYEVLKMAMLIEDHDWEISRDMQA